MKDNKVVTIGGQQYDNVTGLPINPKKQNSPVTDIKPNKNTAKQQSAIKSFRTNARGHIAKSMDIARSKSISHFSSHSTAPKAAPTARPKSQPMDIKPIKHPLAARVEQIRNNQSKNAPKTSISKTPKQIKEEAIAEAMKKADTIKKTPVKAKKQKPMWRKVLLIVLSIVAALVLIGAASYLFLPTISNYVASMQTRVNAKVPTYTPDGYRLNGPVSADNGKVVATFSSTTNNNYFKLTQTSSSWDSSALKNKVNNDSKGEFITVTFDGLTIFTYDNNAAWINDGVLYTISGNAQLSSDQIRQIAISLCS